MGLAQELSFSVQRDAFTLNSAPSLAPSLSLSIYLSCFFLSLSLSIRLSLSLCLHVLLLFSHERSTPQKEEGVKYRGVCVYICTPLSVSSSLSLSLLLCLLAAFPTTISSCCILVEASSGKLCLPLPCNRLFGMHQSGWRRG